MTFSGLFHRKANCNFHWSFRPAVSSEQKTALTFVLVKNIPVDSESEMIVKRETGSNVRQTPSFSTAIQGRDNIF